MDLRDIPKPKFRGPRCPPDLDAEPLRRERPERLRIGGVIPGIHREQRPAMDPGLQVIPDQAEGLRLPPVPRWDEVPDLLAGQNREPDLGNHSLDPPVERRAPGRIEPPIVHRQRQPLRLEAGAGEAAEHRFESANGPPNPRVERRGQRVPVPETGPFDLEPVAAAVQDSPQAYAVSEVKEGASREDGEADAGVGGEMPQRVPNRRGEPCRVGAADQGHEGAVEVQDQAQGRPRCQLALEARLEGTEALAGRRATAQGSRAPRSPTGKRDSSVSRRPAQR